MSITLADQIAYMEMHLRILTADQKKITAWHERNGSDDKEKAHYKKRSEAEFRVARAILQTLRDLAAKEQGVGE